MRGWGAGGCDYTGYHQGVLGVDGTLLELHCGGGYTNVSMLRSIELYVHMPKCQFYYMMI